LGSGRVGFDLTVLPVLSLIMGFGAQINLILVSEISKEQMLRSIRDKN